MLNRPKASYARNRAASRRPSPSRLRTPRMRGSRSSRRQRAGPIATTSATGRSSRRSIRRCGGATLAALAFRQLVRAAGLDAPRSPSPIDAELRRRVLARLAAEDWYHELLIAAQQRKGRVARRQRKIARLLLGRVGRHWHPRVDKTALRTWLAQYRTHEAWLGDRIDPAWVSKLEGRLRRRDIFWSICATLFIGSLLLQFIYLSFVAVIDGPDPLWPLVIAPFAAVFLFWLFKLVLAQLLTLTIPGWTGFGQISAIWSRFKFKKPTAKSTRKPGDAG